MYHNINFAAIVMHHYAALLPWHVLVQHLFKFINCVRENVVIIKDIYKGGEILLPLPGDFMMQEE